MPRIGAVSKEKVGKTCTYKVVLCKANLNFKSKPLNFYAQGDTLENIHRTTGTMKVLIVKLIQTQRGLFIENAK